VAQTVFILLARKPWVVQGGTALPGWLYRTTQRAAYNALRSESRRRRRETEAMKLAEQNQEPARSGDPIEPALDEALHSLNDIEQDAVLLHYYQEKSYREIGILLGLNESAAHKRVERALEKIRQFFARRGVTTTAALLGPAIMARAAGPLPAGLAAKVTGASLAGSAGVGGLTQVVGRIFYSTMKIKTVVVAAAALTVAALLIWQYQEIAQSHAQASEQVTAAQPVATPKAVAPSGVVATPVAANATVAKTDDAALEAAVAYWFNWSEGLRKNHAHPTAEDHAAYLAFLNSLDDNGFAVALAYFDRQGGSQRDTQTQGYLMEWAKKNPVAALVYAEAFAWTPPTPGGVDDRTTTLTLLLQGWVKNDPSGAMAWVQQQPAGPGQAEAAQLLAGQLPDASTAVPLIGLGAAPWDVFSNWAKQDPNAAFNQALALPDGPTRELALKAVFQQADSATALSLAANLTDPTEKAAADKDLAIRSDQDPLTALSLAANFTDEGEKATVIQVVLQKMDPAQALNYIASLPADTPAAETNQDVLAAVVLGKVARTGSAAASAAAAQWLQSLPAGTDLQQSSIINYADALAAQNPAAATPWIEAINDPAARARLTDIQAKTNAKSLPQANP